MPTITVADSTSVQTVAFDPYEDAETVGLVHVTFTSGRTYEYDMVPVEIFDQINEANENGGSVGSLVRTLLVKGGFLCQEISV